MTLLLCLDDGDFENGRQWWRGYYGPYQRNLVEGFDLRDTLCSDTVCHLVSMKCAMRDHGIKVDCYCVRLGGNNEAQGGGDRRKRDLGTKLSAILGFPGQLKVISGMRVVTVDFAGMQKLTYVLRSRNEGQE